MKNTIIILICFFTSCSKIFFVDKTKVIHNGSGYLLFYNPDKCLLIPSRDTSIDQFFKDSITKKGYLLYNACGANGLKLTAKKYDVDMVYLDSRNNNKEVYFKDSIYLTTINFNYLLNREKPTIWKDTVEFIYKGTKLKINTSDRFYGNVQKIEGNAIYE